LERERNSASGPAEQRRHSFRERRRYRDRWSDLRRRQEGWQGIQPWALELRPYEQDQVIALEQEQENGRRYATLEFSDRPDTPIRWDLNPGTPQGKAEFERLAKAGALGHPRLSIGRRSDRSSGVTLSDDKGRPRLYLNVTAEGVASIAFLDENGKPVRTLTADGK
jgi:hypothetical protein